MYLGWYSDNIIKPLFCDNYYWKLEYQQSYCINYLRINTILTPMIGSAIFLKLTFKYNRRYKKRNRARKCRKQMKQIFQANHTFHKINIYNYFLNFELSTLYWQLYRWCENFTISRTYILAVYFPRFYIFFIPYTLNSMMK